MFEFMAQPPFPGFTMILIYVPFSFLSIAPRCTGTLAKVCGLIVGTAAAAAAESSNDLPNAVTRMHTLVMQQHAS